MSDVAVLAHLAPVLGDAPSGPTVRRVLDLAGTCMSDVAVLAHLAPVLGDAPSGPTVRRVLDLAGTSAVLDRIARARAKARAHVWDVVEGTPARFLLLVIAGEDPDGVTGHRHGRHLGHVAEMNRQVLTTLAA